MHPGARLEHERGQVTEKTGLLTDSPSRAHAGAAVREGGPGAVVAANSLRLGHNSSGAPEQRFDVGLVEFTGVVAVEESERMKRWELT